MRRFSPIFMLAVAALVACLLPAALGFALPAAVLLRMSLEGGDARASAVFGQLAANSFLLAAGASVLAVLFATLLAYALRIALPDRAEL